MSTQQLLKLSLKGASAGIDHYEKVVDPLKKHAKRLVSSRSRRRNERNRISSDESDYDDDDGRPRRRYNDRYTPSSRSDRRSGGGAPVRIVEEYERRRGRTLSTGDDPYHGGRPGPQYARNRDPYDSDSESSLSPSPPRRRRNTLGQHDRTVAEAAGAAGAAGAAALAARDLDSQREDLRRLRLSDDDYSRDSYDRDGYPTGNRSRATSSHRRRPAGKSDRSHNNLAVAPRYNNNNNHNSNTHDKSTVTGSGSRRGGGSHSTRSASVSSSATSTSDLCSSSEDERRIKKMRGKEYLSAGLAAVATIHAASGLFSSLEARDKRYEELRKGEITADDAKRKRNKARLQDVAAIGIAALGIKGAYSEWQEVQETRNELRQQKEERKRRHEKRMRLRERAQSRGGGDRYRRDDGRRDGYRSA